MIEPSEAPSSDCVGTARPLDWLRGYDAKTLRGDLVAALHDEMSWRMGRFATRSKPPVSPGASSRSIRTRGSKA